MLTEKHRVQAQKILMSDKSDDLKLLEVFDIYKGVLKEEYSQLYYALLGWKYSHLEEFVNEQQKKAN